MDPTLTHQTLQLRKSMLKFESNYNKLDVLNIAKYIPCYLNRQVIIILSALGIADSVFSNLQDLMLNKLSGMLVEKRLADLAILKYYRSEFSFVTTRNDFSVNYLHEPFFRDLLKAIYRKSLQSLISKSRIFVEHGRILMGTLDETGLLKENEVYSHFQMFYFKNLTKNICKKVFIQCSSVLLNDYEDNLSNDSVNTEKHFIVRSRVAVAKNPCMHPGDLRVLNAVDLPALRHMFDCIVFPSVGSRPITNMCSGSDLDGDLYFVTWEPSLIPKHMEEPMEYDSPPAKNNARDIDINDVIDFFVKFIEIDQLGRIANAHVALSDFSAKGVLDPICIELAKAFSLAVDFPKTGLVPQMPNSLKSIKYPDFMEKKGSSYQSQKIIGNKYFEIKKLRQNLQILI